MPKGFSNLTGLPHSPPSTFGRLGWNKGLLKEKQPFFGMKHTEEAKEKMREYRLANPSTHQFKKGHTTNVSGESKETIMKRANTKYKEKHGDRIKEFRYLRRYGITLAEYEEMARLQNGLCAACFRSPRKKLCVDHDHETGKVRGLLCFGCNTALGLAQDDVEILNNLINYLLKNQ